MKQIWRKSVRTRIEQQERWFVDNYTYRSILTHPKCRLYYRYNDDEVVFYKVHFSLMKPLP